MVKNGLSRYNLITTSAGERMDGEKLYNLTVVDRSIIDPMFRRTKFEELTAYELEQYKSDFEKLQEAI